MTEELKEEISKIKVWHKQMKEQKELHGDVAVKFDQDKVRMELLPTRPLKDIAEVLTIGAKKYEDNNWRQGFDYSRVYGAAQRHLSDWYSGITFDDETSKNHLAHAACCILFLLEYHHSGAGNDDRVKQYDRKEV